MLTLDAARVHEHSDLASLHKIHNSSVRQSINWEATHHTTYSGRSRSERITDHGLRREVGLELGADDAGVAVRAGDLAPDAPVARLAALGLGLVDVRHPLAAVPRDVLLGVHPLDLHQRRVLVLVRLGPASTTARHRPVSRSAVAEQAGGDRLEWGRGNSPLVSEDGAPDVEPHALPSAPLHHLAAAALPPEVECSGGEGTAQPRREETLAGGASRG